MARKNGTPQAIANRLLAKVSPDELNALRPHMEIMSLEAGYSLIKPRERIREVWFPTTALASLITVLEDGATVEAGSIGREGMAGISVILGTGATPMQTIIQIPGEVIRISAAAIMDVFEKGKTLHALLNHYVHTLFIIAAQSAACNRRHQVGERLARWLLMSSDGIGSDDVGLTHEFLATMLGVRRAGVTEAALKLQRNGLILYKRRGVHIVNRKGLEQAACECYQVVKDEMEGMLS